ncbi:hypothetical protein [Microbulbifer celer]|uniref:Uncharacterized protein n=1 Tax=Microbulbifer celer TaxID=435905 RepID=A0ABW3U5D2_9GAMM|nr:hypothetical protein [Microbulbifer celer]UFN56773.1 hypothetical protein LPW13_14530 [Microbulbifer celer]
MTYQVVFTGDLRSGYDRRQGIEYLSRKFQLDFDRIRSLLSGGRTVVKKLDRRQEGEALVSLFWQGGWIVELEPQNADETPLRETSLEASVDDTSSDDKSRIYSNQKSSDTRCSLVTPTGWQTCAGLNPNALLQVGNLESNQFLVVLCQKKSELTSDIGLQDYCTAQIHQCMTKVSQAKMVCASNLLPGSVPQQYSGEFSAEVSGTPIQYLVAVSENGVAFYTHIFWCEQRQFDVARGDFYSILKSFRIESEASLSSVDMLDCQPA